MGKPSLSQIYSKDNSAAAQKYMQGDYVYEINHSHPPTKDCTQQDRAKIATCCGFFKKQAKNYGGELGTYCKFAADEDEELLKVLKDEQQIELAKAQAPQTINVTCTIS